MSKRLIGLLAALLVLAPIASRAEEGPGTVYSKDKYPEELAKRPLTLPAGMAEIYVPVNVNLSKDETIAGVTEFGPFKPVRINPSVYFGITDDIMVGLYTEVEPATPMFAGLCLTGESKGCYPFQGVGKGGFLAPVLNTIAGEGVVSLLRKDDYQLAAFAGVEFLTIADPTIARARFGLSEKWAMGNFALPVKLGVHIGLNNRDLAPGLTDDTLFVDAEPTLNVTKELAVFVRAAMGSNFSNFSDLITIPVGAGFEYAVNHNVDFGAKFEFGNLLGKHAAGVDATDDRLGTVFAKVRL
ncbi:hypothetical protein [Anaeromyxobacter paludicola]|uniref:Outer membrane protein beta-barrel domain-containing protein n=1 Tax=Anaeromyxobacter paludicola TaxID=2918171 RepID=A0ABM7XA54_9BACT|nr:hypothetical protein [Anaeromyxobacter paludicola]BDG08744.1 hypothetical protein AMPC_18570 [Anaeromyxobacter paludicola]